MSGRQSKKSDKRQSGYATSNSERSGSSYSANTPILDAIASPIPISNAVFYCNVEVQSGSTTPESEVESSLAYKGTQRYSSKARRNRKLTKKKEQPKSKNNEVTDDYEKGYIIDKETHLELPVMVDILEDNCKCTQTYFSGDSVNSNSPGSNEKSKKVVRVRHGALEDNQGSNSVQTSIVESKSVQTDLLWFEVENLFENIDNIGLDEMKQLLLSLKMELCGRKQPIPGVHFNEMISEESSSDESILEEKDATTPNDKNGNAANEETEIYDLNLETKESMKKISLQSEEPAHFHHRNSLTADVHSRRVNSAHCIGQQKETLQEEVNIFDLFKEIGEQAKKEEAQILKYVGEKPDIKPDTREHACVSGWFEGLCQFCGKQLLVIPTLEQTQDPTLAPRIPYCCAEFKYFINLHLLNEESESFVDEVIDVNPNAPFGSKNNRKAARERLADRQRERELERQKAAAQQANLFSFARQMKTIQYSLASTKCMNEGWTIKPTSPPPPEPIMEENQFEVEVNSTLLQTAGVSVNKSYDNGKPFLTIFPDGTGCCYYPSGHAAVMISSTEKGKYTYVVQTNKAYEDLEDCGLLAVFEANGNSVCYYKKKQRIRTFINAHGGIELDQKGRKRKRWQWYFIKGHVHTPPFHPLCFSLNKFLSVRVLDQHNIALIFASNKRSVRFNVGAHLKALTIRGRGQFEGDESEKYLTERKKKIGTILKNLHGALRLPKSAREGTFPTTSQRKKEHLKKVMLGQGHLPPIEDKPLIIS